MTHHRFSGVRRLLGLLLLSMSSCGHVAVAQSSPEDNFFQAKECLEYGAYSNALSYFLEAAHHNHAKAQYNVAIMYRKGMGVTPSDAKALYWLKRAADNHNKRAAATHAKLLQHCTKEARHNKNAKAQTTLGIYHILLHGIQQNEEAYQWFSLATAQEDAPAEAHFYMARYCFIKHRNRDTQLKHMKIAAEKGDAKAMEFYVLLSRHVGKALDEQKEFEWILKAAHQHNYSAMRAVARYYSQGSGGVSKNEQEANKWMQQALACWIQNADLWDENALLELIVHLLENRDKKMARMYTQRLLHAASEHSDTLIDLLTRVGGSLPDDLYYAIASKAAKSGYGTALFYLATCYGDGRGVPKSHKKAVEYLTKALNSPDMNMYPQWKENIKIALKQIQETDSQ